MTKEYSFDVKLWAVIRVQAEDEFAAKQVASSFIDAVAPSGDFIDGYNVPLAERGVAITDVSLETEEGDQFVAFEVDGEPVED